MKLLLLLPFVNQSANVGDVEGHFPPPIGFEVPLDGPVTRSAWNLQGFRDECIRLQNEIRFVECQDPDGTIPCANWKFNDGGLSDEGINVAAQKHAEAMLEWQYFGHVGHNGTSVQDRGEAEGYKSNKGGENIAFGTSTPEAVINLLYNSPGHHAAMVYYEYTECGIGHTGEQPSPNGNMRYFSVFNFGTGHIPDEPTYYPPSTPEEGESDEDFLHRLINAERSLAGCEEPIYRDICMTPVAYGHALDMVENEFLGWRSSDGTSLGGRHEKAGCAHFKNGIYGVGIPTELIRNTRKNDSFWSHLVKCDYNVIGIGRADDHPNPKNAMKWSLDFGIIDEIPDQDLVPKTSSTESATTPPWPTSTFA